MNDRLRESVDALKAQGYSEVIVVLEREAGGATVVAVDYPETTDAGARINSLPNAIVAIVEAIGQCALKPGTPDAVRAQLMARLLAEAQRRLAAADHDVLTSTFESQKWRPS